MSLRLRYMCSTETRRMYLQPGVCGLRNRMLCYKENVQDAMQKYQGDLVMQRFYARYVHGNLYSHHCSLYTERVCYALKDIATLKTEITKSHKAILSLMTTSWRGVIRADHLKHIRKLKFIERLFNKEMIKYI